MPNTALLKRPLYVALFLATVFFAVSTASARQQLTGHVPKEVSTSPLLGSMDSSATLDLAIGLPIPNSSELDQLLKDLYDPHNPLYRHFLSPTEFDARFAPSASDYKAILDFAAQHHLQVKKTYSDRLLVDVTGTVEDIQNAFHVHLNRYRRTDGSEFHAPDRDPSVDIDIPINHISNLENVDRPKPKLKHGNSGYIPSSFKPKYGTSPMSGGDNDYFGTDYRNIYVPCLSSSYQGAGQTVALIEFDSYYSSDITEYSNAATFSTPQINNIAVDGFNTSGTPVTIDDVAEIDLDIDMVISMAQKARVNVYEISPYATNAQVDDMLEMIANDGTAKQISCSWGPLGDGNSIAYFNKFVAQGQAFFEASGDLGAYVSTDPDQVVSGPMDITSNLTAVGGTEVTTSGAGGKNGSVGIWQSETTWNDSPGVSATTTPVENAVTSGGICTSVLAIPTYQVPFDNANSVSNQWRNIPDVAMVADYIDIYVHGAAYEGTGGTSAASPLWAGLTALINEQAKLQAKGPVGFLNPYLYTLANNGGTYTATDFHDIQTGNNNYWGNHTNEYTAGTGYDLTTGLGSPNCSLVSALVGTLATNTVTPTPTNTYTPTNTPTVTNTPPPPTTSTSYAYPQPAHGQVNICYNSPAAQTITINLYNLVGQLVGTFTDNAQASNNNRVALTFSGYAPGIYFYILRSPSGVMTKGKFLLEP